MGLSIVIPSFNSAEWLPETLDALSVSLNRSSWESEVIIVNDGSTDNTAEVLNNEILDTVNNFRIINQENQGRFLARWAGISAAKHEQILLLDSRVIIGEDSLGYLERTIERIGQDFVWNAFVETDPNSSLPGFFWDVPTRLFWGKFLSDPKPVRFGLKDFDKYPKGTGCLFLEKALLETAYLDAWPEGDLTLVSDDTRLLREIVRNRDIVLDPEFYATYRPRVDISSFLNHTFTRGTLFVDSYAGTSLARRLIILVGAFAPLVTIVLVAAGHPWLLGIAGLIVLTVPTVIGALRRAPIRAIASFLLLVLPFGFLFWAGLVRGIWLHRRHFARRGREDSK